MVRLDFTIYWTRKRKIQKNNSQEYQILKNNLSNFDCTRECLMLLFSEKKENGD
jgi:hypothetical protein